MAAKKPTDLVETKKAPAKREYKGATPTEQLNLTPDDVANMVLNPVGRPRTVLNEDEVRKLAAIGCSINNIADFFQVSPNTIIENFHSAYLDGSRAVSSRLRSKQVELAMNGNVPMLIHLGKTMLKQKEVTEHIHSVEQPITNMSDEEVLRRLELENNNDRTIDT